ncbi:hypothetical protein [Flavobacterium lacus]|uniref:Uncharacterized protein n=1 Tax=Flavobacterium lacus TaxID=1353778 RepID=A0A328WMI4_9FLAO|nr:hypothetical protein [Flavobacterium lacus]RAR46465.1 hypothetical protein B0I10_11924 [Flavobacterium lacus]
MISSPEIHSDFAPFRAGATKSIAQTKSSPEIQSDFAPFSARATKSEGKMKFTPTTNPTTDNRQQTTYNPPPKIQESPLSNSGILHPLTCQTSTIPLVLPTSNQFQNSKNERSANYPPSRIKNRNQHNS